MELILFRRLHVKKLPMRQQFSKEKMPSQIYDRIFLMKKLLILRKMKRLYSNGTLSWNKNANQKSGKRFWLVHPYRMWYIPTSNFKASHYIHNS